MKTIYKYPLYVGENNLYIPVGAEFLHVAEQHGQITVWALIDINVVCKNYRIGVFGTGHEIPYVDLKHLGTVLCSDGLVWHAFLYV